MHLKLRRKPSRLLLALAVERPWQTCKSIIIKLLYKIDTLAEGVSRLAADVHLWSAEKYGVMSMLEKKILIVDDSPSQVKLIQGFLEHEGYLLVGINDPEQVEEAIRLERPSVILLDVVMPKRNGFQVCRELKNHVDYNAIPVILVTSKNTESDKFWGQQQGADGYVTKPFTREELLRAVRRFA
jgi:twitching motility two-component system response regulator PilH